MRHVWVIGFLLTAVFGGGGLFLMEEVPREPIAVAREEGLSVTVTAEVPDAPARDRIVEVPILVYHTVRKFVPGDGPLTRQYNVTPETFEAHLSLLKDEGYETIGFDELEGAILRGGELPEKPVILTFDDGTASHHANAFPLLEKYGFTGTFFVFSNAVDRPNYLTSEQIRAMRDAGMRFGNHTRYHQYLTRIPDDESVDEMREGKARMEEILGEEVGVIAYPFGLHDDDVVSGAAMLGHRLGRTIREDRAHGPEDLMTLGAYQMNDTLRRLEYALGM